MSVDVRVDTLIHQPRTVVAEFMFDPRNDAAWTTGVIECRPRTAGPLRKGSRVERRATFLGRAFCYEYEVVSRDEDRSVDIRVEKPFPMQIRYELAYAQAGTRVSIQASGDPGTFFRLAGPLLGGMVKRQIGRDLEAMKTLLEGRAVRPLIPWPSTSHRFPG